MSRVASFQKAKGRESEFVQESGSKINVMRPKSLDVLLVSSTSNDEHEGVVRDDTPHPLGSEELGLEWNLTFREETQLRANVERESIETRIRTLRYCKPGLFKYDWSESLMWYLHATSPVSPICVSFARDLHCRGADMYLYKYLPFLDFRAQHIARGLLRTFADFNGPFVRPSESTAVNNVRESTLIYKNRWFRDHIALRADGIYGPNVTHIDRAVADYLEKVVHENEPKVSVRKPNIPQGPCLCARPPVEPFIRTDASLNVKYREAKYRTQVRVEPLNKEQRANLRRDQVLYKVSRAHELLFHDAQAGPWITHGLDTGTADQLENMISRFEEAVYGLNDNVSENVDKFRDIVEDFGNSNKDLLHEGTDAVAGTMRQLTHLLWVVPLIGVCYYAMVGGAANLLTGVVKFIPMILSALLPKFLWDCMEHLWPKPEMVIAQGGGFEPAVLANLLTIAMSLLVVGKTDVYGFTKEFTKNIAGYSRTVDGWTKLSAFLLGFVEKFINHVRNFFGKERITLFKTGVNLVDTWCNSVSEIVNLSRTGGDVMTPDNVHYIMALRNEGNGLLKQYRFTSEVTVMLHKYIGYLDELCRLCSAAMHTFKGGRPQPVVLCLFGAPGVGKTHLTKIISALVMAKAMPHERAKELNYNMDSQIYQFPSGEFWNGYAGHFCTIVDDFGQTVPVPGGENDYINLIRMANCWAYPLNFADLENKGKNFFRSKFILLTTNVGKFDMAQKVIMEPGALTRRIDFGFEITVHPDFAIGEKIDMEKLNNYEHIHGKFPYHAWILRKHVFGIGNEAVTYSSPTYDLEGVINEVAAKIVRNENIHTDNSDSISRYVKASYGIVAQSGRKDSDDSDEAFSEFTECKMREGYNSMLLNLSPRMIFLMVALNDARDGISAMLASGIKQLESCGALPIVSFLISTGAYILVLMILRSAIKSITSWFYKPNKDSIEKALKKKASVDDELLAQALNSFKPSDFEETVDTPNGAEVRKSFTVSTLRRAYERLLGAKVPQSNEPQRTSLSHKVIHTRRILESDTPILPQADPYGNSIADVAARNLYQLSIMNSDGTLCLGHVLFVRDTVAICPLHFDHIIEDHIKNNTVQLHDTVQLRHSSDKGVKLSTTVKDFLNLKRAKSLDDDLLAIRFVSLRAHRDIVDKFIEENDPTYLSKVRIRLDTLEGKDNIVFRSKSMQAVRKDQINVSAEGHTYSLAIVYEYLGYTKFGDCGGVVSLEDASSFQCKRILGIHVAGSPSLGLGFCNVVTQTKIKKLLSEFSPSLISDVTFQCQSEFQLADPPIEGSFHGLCKGMKVHNLNPQTSLCKTPLYGCWGQYDKFPAPLSKFRDPDGVTINPMVNALKPYATPLLEYESHELDLASYQAFEPFNRYTIDHTRSLYSFEKSVAGVPGLFKGIPRNTSPGYPYVLQGHTNKKKFFGNRDEYIFDTTLAVDLKVKVLDVLEKAKGGVRSEHIFVDFLKDELRTSEKVELGRARLISSAPLVYTIAFRMMFLAFTTAVQNTRIRNGVAVGINPYTEWNYLTNHLMSKGGHCIAGDYTAFDSSEQPQIHMVILDRINDWYNDGEENRLVRKVLWMEVVHSRHYGGIHGCCDTIYQWNKSLSSGHPATSIINSFYNLIMFNVVWSDIMGIKYGPEFWKYVYLCTYGDDNVCNVDSTVIDRFNQHTITASMLRHGMIYTAEDKDSEVTATRPLSEVSFLKRSFRYDSVLRMYVGPQVIDSILYIPYWCKNKKLINEITRSNVELTLAELSLHPEAVWDTHAHHIRDACVSVMREHPKMFFSRRSYLEYTQVMDVPWL